MVTCAGHKTPQRGPETRQATMALLQAFRASGAALTECAKLLACWGKHKKPACESLTQHRRFLAVIS